MKIIDMRCRPPIPDLADFFAVNAPAQAKALGYTLPPSFEHRSVDLFMQEMEAAGITQAVANGRNSPPMNLGVKQIPQGISSHDAIFDLVQKYPGKFIPMAGIDVGPEARNMVEALKELDRTVNELKFYGAFIECGRHGIYYNDERMFPIYQKCTDLGVSVIFQGGGGTGPNVNYANPQVIDDVAREFPKVNFICAHGCYPFVREVCFVANRHPNFFVSVDFYLGFPGAHEYVEAANTYLQNQFIFGSAYPLAPMDKIVELHQKAGFKEAVLDRVYHENAERALHLV